MTIIAGVNLSSEPGADILVAGNAIFSAPDPAAEVAALRARCAVHV